MVETLLPGDLAVSVAGVQPVLWRAAGALTHRVGPVLIRARHMAEWARGGRVARGMAGVTYHHLLLPRDALLMAEGCWTESLYPGPEALRALDPSNRLALAEAILRLHGGPGGRIATRRLQGLCGPRCLPPMSAQTLRKLLEMLGLARSGLGRTESRPMTGQGCNLPHL